MQCELRPKPLYLNLTKWGSAYRQTRTSESTHNAMWVRCSAGVQRAHSWTGGASSGADPHSTHATQLVGTDLAKGLAASGWSRVKSQQATTISFPHGCQHKGQSISTAAAAAAAPVPASYMASPQMSTGRHSCLSMKCPASSNPGEGVSLGLWDPVPSADSS